MKKIGIIGALIEEVEQITGALTSVKSEEYAGVIFHSGYRSGIHVVVCCAGMGKTNAAATTQALITKFNVNAVIFSGIAGNMSSEIGIGDVVIGKELCYHDADDRMISQSSPHTALYTADPLLVDAIEQGCLLVGVKYIIGKIATGDQFVGDPELKRSIQKKCGPDCVEMEGAAVAQVSMRNKIPFVVIRTMSDNSDESIESLGAETFEISEYVTTASAVVVAALDSISKF